MNYEKLNSGEILREDDEYSAQGQDWKPIPSFMIGDKVPDCPSTCWRRPIVSNNKRATTDKKSLWKTLRMMFNKS